MKKKLKKIYCGGSFLFAIAVFAFTFILTITNPQKVYAANTGIEDVTPGNSQQAEAPRENNPGLSITYNNGEGSLSTPIKMLLTLTVLTLAPSILIMLTSFTRIVIVLHFVRTAMGTQSAPPNQVLIGLALFLTFFIMSPTLDRINKEAIQPLSRGEITQEEGLKACMEPLRDFMFSNMEDTKDINFFLDMAGIDDVQELTDVPNSVLIPAFIMSELRKAFIIGFLIYIPFIIIDMVVASTLMAMGMMMLPPTTISMPFKILLFVMADGWNLVIGQVVQSFRY